MAADGGGPSAAGRSVDTPQNEDKKSDNDHVAVLEKAEALKAEGNELFKNHHFAEAVAKYSAAIDTIDDSDVDARQTQIHVYLCNRAFAHLRMENFGMTRRNLYYASVPLLAAFKPVHCLYASPQPSKQSLAKNCLAAYFIGMV